MKRQRGREQGGRGREIHLWERNTGRLRRNEERWKERRTGIRYWGEGRYGRGRVRWRREEI